MNVKTSELTKISLLAALSFVSSFISIPIGPVPVTLQTLFVLLTGLILQPKSAALAQLIHLLLSLLIRGFQSFLTPSFGFLISFIFGAFIISYLFKKQQYTLKGSIWAVLVGSVVIYLIGLPYMAYILNVYMGLDYSTYQIMMTGMIVFIPGDAVKAATAVLTAKALYPILKKSRTVSD